MQRDIRAQSKKRSTCVPLPLPGPPNTNMTCSCDFSTFMPAFVRSMPCTPCTSLALLYHKMCRRSYSVLALFGIGTLGWELSGCSLVHLQLQLGCTMQQMGSGLKQGLQPRIPVRGGTMAFSAQQMHTWSGTWKGYGDASCFIRDTWQVGLIRTTQSKTDRDSNQARSAYPRSKALYFTWHLPISSHLFCLDSMYHTSRSHPGLNRHTGCIGY